MKPRYTFSTRGKDGRLYYPYRYGFSEDGIVWPGWAFTRNIKKAAYWDKPEDFDCLMNEFEETRTVVIFEGQKFTKTDIKVKKKRRNERKNS